MRLLYAILALCLSSVYASTTTEKASLRSSGRTSPLKRVKGRAVVQARKKSVSPVRRAFEEPRPVVINFLGSIKALIKVGLSGGCPPLLDEKAVALALQEDPVYKPFMLSTNNLLALDKQLWGKAAGLRNIPGLLEAFGLNPAKGGASKCVDLVYRFIMLFIPLLEDASQLLVKPCQGQVVTMKYMQELPHKMPVSPSRVRDIEAMRISHPDPIIPPTPELVRGFPVVASRAVASFVSAVMELLRQLKKAIDADGLDFKTVMARDLASLWAYAERRKLASAFIELIGHDDQSSYTILADAFYKLAYELSLSYNQSWRWSVARKMAGRDTPKPAAMPSPTGIAKNSETVRLDKDSTKHYLADADFLANLSRAFMTQVLPPLRTSKTTFRSIWNAFTESPFYALLSNPAYALVRGNPAEAASFFAHAISDLVSSKPTHLSRLANAYVALLLKSPSSMDQEKRQSAVGDLCDSMLCYIPGVENDECSLPKWLVPSK